MQRLTLDQLKRDKPAIKQLIVRSFECEIYLVELILKDGLYIFCDAAGRPQMFRSQLAAKLPFKGMGVRETILTQASPYNEMIGLDVGSIEPLSVHISNPDDDYS